jgi:phosphopantothenoylcysteine synthetase/decarboxylase
VRDPAKERALAVVACGAGPARHVNILVELAQRSGWGVRVIATPSAVPFLDIRRLESATNISVRSEQQWAEPTRGRQLPDVDSVIIAPATFNTINKLAAGISDSYALTVVNDALGHGTPVVAVPFVNSDLAGRRPFRRSIELLREDGVRVIFGEEDDWSPHLPGSGGERLSAFPWSRALTEAEGATVRRAP